MPTVDFTLSDRVALVTGGASGIGRAIAVGIAELGGRVALLDRPGSDFSGSLAAIDGLAPATTVEADVTDEAALAAAVATVESELGPLSAAVNAAGIADAAPAEEMPRAQWQRVYDIDVTGVFLSCQAEARAMIASGTAGSIVNVASMSGTIVNRGLEQAHYTSAKAAVIHLSRSLAAEWVGHGIRVNALSPGYTATPMNTRPEMVDRMRVFAEQVPMGRVAEPAEMAGPAVFLLSGASSYVTGFNLVADGGHGVW